MITIITGTPGSGKTLYTVHKLLQSIVGTHIPQDVDGVTVMHERTIYTNINGLLLDHELIDGSDTGGLRNWHEWAKPGSVICFDEVQKIWPPRANGSKVPEDIMALETHRHMGVDFILITQGPMLIDRNLHMLCGRHLHVRRVANMPFATVYEWDAMSRTLNFKSSVNRIKYFYSKAAYKLYKSSSLHTKQPRRLPAVLWGVLLAFGLLGWKGPTVYASLQKPTPQAHAQASDKKDKDTPAAPAPDQTVVAQAHVLAGCMQTSQRCSCYTDKGAQIEMDPGSCQSTTRAPPDTLGGGNLDWGQSTVTLPSAPVWTGTVVSPRTGNYF